MRIILFILLFHFSILSDGLCQKLELWFYPAFHNYSKITLNNDSLSENLKFDIFDKRDTSNIIFTVSKKVSSETLKKFSEFLLSYQFKYNRDIGLDGIMIFGIYFDGDKKNQFTFWSPPKGTSNYQLFNKMCID